MKRRIENIGYVLFLIGAAIYDSSIIGCIALVTTGLIFMRKEKWPCATDQG